MSYDYHIVRLIDWKGIAFLGMFNYFDRNLFNCWRPAADYLQKAHIGSDGLQYWGVLYEFPNVTGNRYARIDAVVTAPGVTDALSWQTDTLKEDLTVTGNISARIFAATTGSDADWIVKLLPSIRIVTYKSPRECRKKTSTLFALPVNLT